MTDPARQTRRETCIWLTAMATLLALAFPPGTMAAAAVDDGAARWLDHDGEPLPFKDDDEALDFLRNAAVVDSQVLEEGINHARRLVLERGDVRARAIFRTVDKTHYREGERRVPEFRDRHGYEVAAYELSRLLGIDNVPPAISRTIDGERGSLQLWIENARSEADRMTRKLPVENAARWSRQRQTMLFFDSLIYNHDRNHGNIIADPRGKLWFVDHTRSFKPLPSLPRTVDKITLCHRRLYQRARDLDPETVHARLAPYLSKVEIDALLKRRQQLVRLVEGLIVDRGETDVLYEEG